LKTTFWNSTNWMYIDKYMPIWYTGRAERKLTYVLLFQHWTNDLDQEAMDLRPQWRQGQRWRHRTVQKQRRYENSRLLFTNLSWHLTAAGKSQHCRSVFKCLFLSFLVVYFTTLSQ
jgi:hypothetical protein